MTQKIDDLKQAFSNGKTPSGADFANLIDACSSGDTLTDAELTVLREMLAWWPTHSSTPAPQPVAPSPTPPAVSSSTSANVPADGAWHALPITSKNPGTWLCSAVTVHPRPGYKVICDAVVVAPARETGLRVLENVVKDSWLPWRTVQLAWRKNSSHVFQLNVRSRRSFGPDSMAKPTQILCRWLSQD